MKTKRIYIENKAFLNFCDEHNCNYVEEDNDECFGVWIHPNSIRKNGTLAICLNDDATFQFGKIDNDCRNFDSEKDMEFHCKEIEWITEILNKISKWKRKYKNGIL